MQVPVAAAARAWQCGRSHAQRRRRMSSSPSCKSARRLVSPGNCGVGRINAQVGHIASRGGPVRQTALLFSHPPSTPRIYTAHPYRASTPRIYAAHPHRASTPHIHTAHLHRTSKWHIHTAQKEKPDHTDPALPITDTLSVAWDKGDRGCLRFLQCHRVLVTAAHGKAQGLFEAAEDKADQGQGQ